MSMVIRRPVARVAIIILLALCAVATQTQVASATVVYTPIVATDPSPNARLGTAVAVSTDHSTVVTGGLNRSTGGTATVGAVYAYIGIPQTNGLTTTETTRLLAGDSPFETTSDQFGAALDVSADGSTVVVGAPNYNFGQGVVYVFSRSGSTFIRTAKITVPSGASQNFGTSVAVSDNGTSLVVGAPGIGVTQQGTTAFYSYSGGTWTFQTQYTGGSNGARYGSSVAISGDGTRAAVGAPKYSTQPRVFTYTNSGTAWSSQSTVLDPSGSSSSDYGRSVALSSNGAGMVVGSPGLTTYASTYRAGAAWVYSTVGGSPTLLTKNVTALQYTGGKLGQSVGISPDGLNVVAGEPSGLISGEKGTNGVTWLFKNTAGTWGSPTTAGPVGLTNDNVATSVAFGGDGRLGLPRVQLTRFC